MLDFNRVHQQSYSPSPIAGESSNRRGHLLNNEANSTDLSLFLPQQNTSMINREQSDNLTACSENNMDIADVHK
jgi:hypothetical protein